MRPPSLLAEGGAGGDADGCCACVRSGGVLRFCRRQVWPISDLLFLSCCLWVLLLLATASSAIKRLFSPTIADDSRSGSGGSGTEVSALVVISCDVSRAAAPAMKAKHDRKGRTPCAAGGTKRATTAISRTAEISPKRAGRLASGC
jgi:hypothetical protein